MNPEQTGAALALFGAALVNALGLKGPAGAAVIRQLANEADDYAKGVAHEAPDDPVRRCLSTVAQMLIRVDPALG